MSTKITGRSRNPINKLPVHQRAYVMARAEGKPAKEAARQAGVGPSMARVYDEKPEVQRAYRYLMQQALPVEKMVDLIRGGCEATSAEYSPEGRKKERPDWKTRKGYIELAVKHSGYFEEKTLQTGNVINLTVQHIGQVNPNGRLAPQLEASTETE